MSLCHSVTCVREYLIFYRLCHWSRQTDLYREEETLTRQETGETGQCLDDKCWWWRLDMTEHQHSLFTLSQSTAVQIIKQRAANTIISRDISIFNGSSE